MADHEARAELADEPDNLERRSDLHFRDASAGSDLVGDTSRGLSAEVPESICAGSGQVRYNSAVAPLRTVRRSPSTFAIAEHMPVQRERHGGRSVPEDLLQDLGVPPGWVMASELPADDVSLAQILGTGV